MVPINPKKLALTLAVVLALFAANTWILLSPAGQYSLQYFKSDPSARSIREFILTPACVSLILAFVVLGLHWAITPHKRHVTEFERLAGIAVAFATALGLLMTYAFNR